MMVVVFILFAWSVLMTFTLLMFDIYANKED